MLIIKNFDKAKQRIRQSLNRFDLSKCAKQYKQIEEIVDSVRIRGDNALQSYSKKFDKVSLETFRVSEKEINSSVKTISKKLQNSINIAIHRIRKFQQSTTVKDKIKNFSKGEKLGYKFVPIESVGIYIPSGNNPLISTVLMTVIPAQVAGVKRIAIFSPPPIHKGILAACKTLKIREIYQVGGAQAIAAAAFGTASIKPVDKVIGPGNIYVTLAKKIVFGEVGIDGLYGPSEIAIIADKTANAKYLAADLLSQLEHGSGLESAFMITNSEQIAKQTQKELFRLVKNLPNKKMILKSLRKNSVIIIVQNLNKACELMNLLAPEHLEIVAKNSNSLLKKIKNAGAVFLGEYSCESIGDYIAGPSHCLPTGGSAKFSSGLTVMDFMKKISVISFNKKAFNKVAKTVIELANAEGLKAHGDAVKIRGYV